MAERPPPHPPVVARHPGRPGPSPHLKAREQQALHRPHEKLHLARHGLAGHHHKPKPPEGGDGS